MNGRINKTLNKIYHDMSLEELKRSYTNNYSDDLSYHDILYLNIISGHPNEYTSSQIADMLNITRPSVTQKINELCKKGYVVRTQSEKDKRVYYLDLSQEVAEYFHASEEEKAIEAMLYKKYGEQAVDLLCNMLEDISNYSHDEQKGGDNEK